KAQLHAARQARRQERGLRHLDEIDRPVGPGDGEAAVSELDVERRRFEQMAGDELAFLDDLLGRAEESGAPGARRARAEGAAAVEDEIGVAIDEAHALRR